MLSVWPLVVGVGFFFLYLSLAFLGTEAGWGLLALGVLVASVSLFGWIREDIRLFPKTFAPTAGNHVGFWGAIFFLCTEFMLFGALFAGFFTARSRLGTEGFFAGAPEFPIGLITVNTIILVSSGFTMHWAQNRIAENDRRKFVWGLVATLVLGSIFVGLQAFEYVEFIHEGFVLGSSQFATTFFMLTGTHGLHVVAGLVFIALMLWRGLAGSLSKEHHVAVEACALYWHFVDAVWIVVYVVVYLRWV